MDTVTTEFSLGATLLSFPCTEEGAEAQRAIVTHKVTPLRRGCLTPVPTLSAPPMPTAAGSSCSSPHEYASDVRVQNETLLCGNDVSDLGSHLTTLDLSLLLCHRKMVGPSQLAHWLD